MTKSDIAIYWIISCFGALTVVSGKLGYALFGIAEAPPVDPVAAAHWKRKRLWLAISEMSAIPAFATISIAVTVYFSLPVAACVLLSMAMGGLGTGFLLNGLQLLAQRRAETLGITVQAPTKTAPPKTEGDQ